MAIAIEKEYNYTLGGDVAIMFDKSDGMFYVKYPENVCHDSLITDKVLTFAEAKQLSKDCIKNYTQTRFFKQKVIAIRLASSMLPEISGLNGNANLIRSYGCAVGIDWMVLNEYEVLKWKYRREPDGMKDRMTVYKNVYYTVPELYYEALYGSKSNIKSISGLNPGRDCFSSWVPTHILPYTEELEVFMVNTEASMTAMVEKVTNFFNTDTTKFIENVQSNIKAIE